MESSACRFTWKFYTKLEFIYLDILSDVVGLLPDLRVMSGVTETFGQRK